MDERDIFVGAQFRMPAKMVDVVVVQIDEWPKGCKRVRLENINGKNPGNCRWETMEYFTSLNAERI